MSDENTFFGLVIAGMAMALGAILLYRFLGVQPIGGGEPNQHRSFSPTNAITPQTPPRTMTESAPVVQNTPITEAAYNQHMTDHAPAFGRGTNTTDVEAVLPQ